MPGKKLEHLQPKQSPQPPPSTHRDHSLLLQSTANSLPDRTCANEKSITSNYLQINCSHGKAILYQETGNVSETMGTKKQCQLFPVLRLLRESLRVYLKSQQHKSAEPYGNASHHTHTHRRGHTHAHTGICTHTYTKWFKILKCYGKCFLHIIK